MVPLVLGVQKLGICTWVTPYQSHLILQLFIRVYFSLASNKKDLCLKPVFVFWFLLTSLIPVLSYLSDVTDITYVKLLTQCLVYSRCSVSIFLLLKVAQSCSYASRGSEQKAFIKLENKNNLCCFLVRDVSLRQNST